MSTFQIIILAGIIIIMVVFPLVSYIQLRLEDAKKKSNPAQTSGKIGRVVSALE
jgi:hypothetical protein